MIKTQQYDIDNATVRHYDSAMVKTRKYDDENAILIIIELCG